MKKQKISISISENLVHEVDLIAGEQQSTRSAVIERLLYLYCTEERVRSLVDRFRVEPNANIPEHDRVKSLVAFVHEVNSLDLKGPFTDDSWDEIPMGVVERLDKLFNYLRR